MEDDILKKLYQEYLKLVLDISKSEESQVFHKKKKCC